MLNAHLVAVPRTTFVPTSLAADVARAAAHAAHARAPNTHRAYASAWERWESYAFDHGARHLPASPLVVAAYLAHLDAEGLSHSSLAVTMAAIVDRHRAARVALPSNDPVVRDVLAGRSSLKNKGRMVVVRLAPFVRWLFSSEHQAESNRFPEDHYFAT